MSKFSDGLSEVRDLLQHLMTQHGVSTVEAAETFERENKLLLRRITPLLVRQQLIALAGDVARKRRRTGKHGDQLLLPEIPRLPISIPIPGLKGKKQAKLRAPLSDATISAVRAYCEQRAEIKSDLTTEQHAAVRLLELLAPFIKSEEMTVGEAIAAFRKTSDAEAVLV